MKRFLVFLLLLVNLYPAFGAYQEPTVQEKDLYNSLVEEFEKLSVSKKDVSDTLKSFDEPIVVYFPCEARDINKSVDARITTRLARFDDSLASHEGAITGGIYVWKCHITYSNGNVAINCNNELMLNSDALINQMDDDPQVKRIEDLAVLYHELLHGQLMIDAVKSSKSWRHDTCNKNPQSQIDYSYTDGNHQVITPLQTDFVSQLITKIGGILQVEEISPQETADGAFTKKVGTVFDYPQYVRTGISISARSYNTVNIQIYSQKNDIMVSGHLINNTQPGIVWLYVFGQDNSGIEPKTTVTSQPTTTNDSGIPTWIKNNAKWWSEGTIGDADFVLGIQYLINSQIIVVPDSETKVDRNNGQIPAWIKNNAKWWSEGTISDTDFVQGLQYLIKTGIIQAQINTNAQPDIHPVDPDLGTLSVSDEIIQKRLHEMFQMRITGTVADFQPGNYITLTIVNPDQTSYNLKGILTKKGDFSVPFVVYDGSQVGDYLVTAKYENLEFGQTSFSIR